jgi:hypothetical protein
MENWNWGLDHVGMLLTFKQIIFESSSSRAASEWIQMELQGLVQEVYKIRQK